MKPTIHQLINLRMANLLNYYLVTRDPQVKNYIPSNMKGKARYNTCYDFPRPMLPLEMINEYINGKGDRVREYLINNLKSHAYLRVDIYPSSLGTLNKFSLLKELPNDYEELERTGAVRFVKSEEVKL